MKIKLNRIIEDFDLWYKNSYFFKYEDYYSNILTYQLLTNAADSEFKESIYSFVEQGGMIMEHTSSYKIKFQKNMINEFDGFKKFVLMPYDEKFNLKKWFDENNNKRYFGFGTATVFLNRTNKEKFPICNLDTEKALSRLGFKIYKPNKNNYYNYYKRITEYKKYLLKYLPKIDNYYKLQAFCWYLIHTKEGRKFITSIKNEKWKFVTDEDEIYKHIENEYYIKEKLFEKIIKYAKSNSTKITINSVSYKRDSYQMALIKKYHDYKCQFCSTKIKKMNGQYYIEACHIKAKAKGGNENINNILVLCPNCHKLFDVGERKEIEHTNIKYVVELNGKIYTAVFAN